jgi:hypothetical protein
MRIRYNRSSIVYDRDFKVCYLQPQTFRLLNYHFFPANFVNLMAPLHRLVAVKLHTAASRIEERAIVHKIVIPLVAYQAFNYYALLWLLSLLK